MGNNIIWCNERVKFNNNVLIYAHWSKSGMRFLSDILSGGVLNRESVKSRLHKKAGFIFEYSRLSRAISSYSGILAEDSVSEVVPRFQDMLFKVPDNSELCLKRVYDLTSKDIYSILLDPYKIERKSEVYWSDKFQEVPLNFSNWYINLLGSRVISHKVSKWYLPE